MPTLDFKHGAKAEHLLVLLGCIWERKKKPHNFIVQRLTADRMFGNCSSAAGCQIPAESRTSLK